MAFGANRKGAGDSPGQSNMAIARIVNELWQTKHLPIIAQREVAEALAELRLPKPDLVISEAAGQFHIDSHEVLRRAWIYSRARTLRHAVIVAHPAHILRCKAVAERMGFKVKLPDVSSVPYEPSSKQWWTRNPLAFLIWELFARISWRKKGWL